MPPDDPIRDLWFRVRGLGRKVEEELYDFSEEEELEEEPRGRNTLIALLNAFLTMWKASQANVAERTLGILGFGGLLWLIFDRGIGVRRPYIRLAAWTVAALWFVPGLIAAVWTLFANLGVQNLRRVRLWPLFLTFAAGGLISFRTVFSDLARQRPRPAPPPKGPASKR